MGGQNPSILPHILTMSICSAIGQLFIFHTIKKYGPLVFATIQTVRQLLSIILSILFFGHPINAMEGLGITIVFLALSTQTGYKWQQKKQRKSLKDEAIEIVKEPAELEKCIPHDNSKAYG